MKINKKLALLALAAALALGGSLASFAGSGHHHHRGHYAEYVGSFFGSDIDWWKRFTDGS